MQARKRPPRTRRRVPATRHGLHEESELCQISSEHLLLVMGAWAGEICNPEAAVRTGASQGASTAPAPVNVGMVGWWGMVGWFAGMGVVGAGD